MAHSFYNPFDHISKADTLRYGFFFKIASAFITFYGNDGILFHGKKLGIYDYLMFGIPYLLQEMANKGTESEYSIFRVLGYFAAPIFTLIRLISSAALTLAFVLFPIIPLVSIISKIIARPLKALIDKILVLHTITPHGQREASQDNIGEFRRARHISLMDPHTCFVNSTPPEFRKESYDETTNCYANVKHVSPISTYTQPPTAETIVALRRLGLFKEPAEGARYYTYDTIAAVPEATLIDPQSRTYGAV